MRVVVTAVVGEHTLALTQCDVGLHIAVITNARTTWEHEVTWQEYVNLVRAIAIANNQPIYVGIPKE